MIERVRLRRVRLMLDSGAFTAFKKRQALSLDQYIEFVHRNRAWLHSYVNLDTIPGQPGNKPTREQIAQSAAQSYQNLQVMRDAGLDPLPVFHQGEAMRRLEKLLHDGHDYIGLATNKTRPALEQEGFLTDTFSVLGSTRTHGFGITKPAFLRRFPFTTVDSTTWIKAAGYGTIYAPVEGERVWVSNEGQRTYHPNNFEARDSDTQDCVRQFVADCGLSMVDVRYSHRARQQVNLAFFTNLARETNTTIFFATNHQTEFADDLAKLGVRNQLLSYWSLKDLGDDALRRYVETGLIPRIKPARVLVGRSYWRMRAIALEKRLGF